MSDTFGKYPNPGPDKVDIAIVISFILFVFTVGAAFGYSIHSYLVSLW